MAADYVFTADSKKVMAALKKAPQAMTAELNHALFSGAHEVAREAKALAPMAFSHLVNSIIPSKDGDLAYRVAAGEDYAAMVELGTGPHYPRPWHIQDWIERIGLQPEDPNFGVRGLAFAIADSISRKGTPAQPFMKPALDKMRGRIDQLVDEAIGRALAKAGLA